MRRREFIVGTGAFALGAAAATAPAVTHARGLRHDGSVLLRNPPTDYRPGDMQTVADEAPVRNVRRRDTPHIRDWDGVAADGNNSDLAVINRAIVDLTNERASLEAAAPSNVTVPAPSLELCPLHLIDGPILADCPGFSLVGAHGGLTTLLSRALTVDSHVFLKMGPDASAVAGMRTLFMGCKDIVFEHRRSGNNHTGEAVVFQNLNRATIDNVHGHLLDDPSALGTVIPA